MGIKADMLADFRAVLAEIGGDMGVVTVNGETVDAVVGYNADAQLLGVGGDQDSASCTVVVAAADVTVTERDEVVAAGKTYEVKRIEAPPLSPLLVLHCEVPEVSR